MVGTIYIPSNLRKLACNMALGFNVPSRIKHGIWFDANCFGTATGRLKYVRAISRAGRQ